MAFAIKRTNIWTALLCFVCFMLFSVDAKANITLGYLTGSEVHPDSDNYFYYNKPGRVISGAITLAVNRINADPDLLPDHDLQFIVAETYGSEEESIKQTVELLQRDISAYIGPQETCMYEARIAAAFNVPMISYFCTDPRLSDKTLFPTFGRTKPHDSQIAAGLVSVLQSFDVWEVTVVSNTHDQSIVDVLEQTLQYHDINVEVSRHYSGVIGLVNFPVIEETYQTTSAYILIMDLYDDYRTFLTELRRLGNGDHVVLAVSVRRYDKDDPQKYVEGYFGSVLTAEEIDAFENFLLLAPSAPVDPYYEDFSTLVNHYLEAPPFNFINPFSSQGITKILRAEASYLYDAVFLYARAAHEAWTRGLDHKDGRVIMDLIKHTTYTSAMGFNVQVDENGNAKGNFTLLSLHNSTEGYGMYPAATLVEDNQSDTGLHPLYLENREGP